MQKITKTLRAISKKSALPTNQQINQPIIISNTDFIGLGWRRSKKNRPLNKLEVLRLIIRKKNIMSIDKLEKWERKRLQTFNIFCLLYMVNGMKYCLFIETCWIYVKRQLSPESHDLIYSAIICSRYLAAGIFNFPLINHDFYEFS